MSIEQTNQLILLLLNTVLMTLLAVLVTGGTWLRQHWLFSRLRQVRSRYHQLTHPKSPLQNTLTQLEATELKKTREHRQQLVSQYHWSRVGLLSLHIAVLVLGVSLFALTLRSLIAFDSLINTALLLFALGVSSFLVGISCLLIDLAHGNDSGESLGHTFAHVIKQLAQQWSIQKLRRTLPLDRKV